MTLHPFPSASKFPYTRGKFSFLVLTVYLSSSHLGCPQVQPYFLLIRFVAGHHLFKKMFIFQKM
jgi:hypothetical protein